MDTGSAGFDANAEHAKEISNLQGRSGTTLRKRADTPVGGTDEQVRLAKLPIGIGFHGPGLGREAGDPRLEAMDGPPQGRRGVRSSRAIPSS